MTISPKHTRVLMRAALFAVLLAVVTHTRADPDLFGNVRFGRDVIAARSAVVPDAYSFTSGGTFVNHEWLSEAILAAAYSAAGAPGLLVVKLGLLLLTGLAIASALSISGAREPRGDMLLAIAALTTFPQTNQIRAQLFSLALFAFVLLVLTIGRKKPFVLLWLVPAMALWPNLHGGWIVAAGSLAVWSGAGIVMNPRSRAAWIVAGVSVIALAATVINPWGWRMWEFLYQTVGLNRTEIRDWQPPFTLGPMYGVLWLIAALTAVASVTAAASMRSIDWPATAVVALLGVASFRVSRLTAFFALSGIVLLGPHFAQWLERRHAARPPRMPTRMAATISAAVAAIVIAGAATLSARNLSCISMDGDLFPEPELAATVRTLGLHGRMMNWFDYGHYAIWHFSPELKVSIDGRRETLYSKALIDQHLAFYFSPASRRATLDALTPDYIWMPTRLEVTTQLIADGWKPLFRGPLSTLLANPSNPGNLANPANLVNPANPVSPLFPRPLTPPENGGRSDR